MKIKSASGIGTLNAALFAGAAAALSLHVAAPAAAANLEVCPSGCAYATIQGAIDAAAPGDFLTVGPGIYLERIRIDKVIDVVSTGGPTVTTINGGGGGTTVTFGAPGAPSLFGFTVTGGDAGVAYGGGILASNGARPVINYCVVAGNSAQYGAGIACLATSSVSIANSRVTGNQTVGTAGKGGGIFLDFNALPAAVTACEIAGNQSAVGGGIYAAYAGAHVFSGSLVSGNRATGLGGGFFWDDGIAVVDRCTVAGNSAGVAQGGGGMGGEDNGGLSVQVADSILWGNEAGGAANAIGAAGSYNYLVGTSDVQGGWPGTGNISADPLFVAPQPASAAPTGAGDYHLAEGSPCPTMGAYPTSLCTGPDADFDGFFPCSGDCNDADALVNPGAAEVCDGVDNNCDGLRDEGFDFDLDGYASCVDCDDANALVNPGAAEICKDRVDNNCNGLVDRGDPACTPENCTNGVDDDTDGLIDCLDPGCAKNRACR